MNLFKKIIGAVNELNDVEGVPHGQIKRKISWGALFIYLSLAGTIVFAWLFIDAKNNTITTDQYNAVVVERNMYRDKYDSLVIDNYMQARAYAKSMEDKIRKVDSLNDAFQAIEYKQRANAAIYNQTMKTLKNAAN